MKKFALLLVALCLVVGFSESAWAVHLVQVQDDGFDVGIEDVNIRFHVLTAVGVWSTFDVPTDGDGIAVDNHNSDTSAMFWWAEVVDTEWANTDTGQIPYPEVNAVMELDNIR
jgi:hypothetical protein